MASDTQRPHCFFAGCGQLADYELEGQWSWFDWLSIDVCLEHMVRGIKCLRDRRVDGQTLASLTQKPYYTEENLALPY